MDILSRNCGVLTKKNPGLAERVLCSSGGVDLEATRSGDYTFRYCNRYFHSRFEPWKEARLQAGEIKGRKPDWVILFGLGCGYLATTLAREGFEQIIIYEPSMEILKGVLGKVDLTELLSREKVLLFDDVREAIEAVRSETEGIDNLLGYQTAPYRAAFPERLSEFTNKVENAHITNKVGIKTDIESRLAWIDNYLANLANLYECPPVDVLKGKLKGVPLVIAGAGPSLKKNAGFLRGLKGKVVVIAAVTAYLPLLKMGVVPDFVIAAEKVDLPEYFTKGPEDRKVRLLLAEVSHPGMFEKDVLGKLVFYNGFMNLSIAQAPMWGSSTFTRIGGSVTTAALDIGVMLGCDPIIFIGQDLSFGEKATHAPGGVYVAQDIRIDSVKGEVLVSEDYITNKDKVVTSHSLLWLKGQDGRPVPSKFDWVTFHQWLENYMWHLRREGPGIRVINSTEGGAYIEGMEHMPLSEALGLSVRGDIGLDGIIENAIAGRPPVDTEGLVNSFKEMLDGIRYISKRAAGIIREAEAAKKKLGRIGLTPELGANLKTIRKLEGEALDRASKAPLLWESLSAYTQALKEYLREETHGDDTARFTRDLEKVRESYSRMIEMCGRLAPVIEGAIATVKGLEDGCPGIKKTA